MMTQEDIMDWQGEMFILSCWLYANNYETVFDDPMFDDHCEKLLQWYDDLSVDFQIRIDRDRLRSGTAMGLEYFPEEPEKAKAWFRRIRGRDPVCYDDI